MTASHSRVYLRDLKQRDFGRLARSGPIIVHDSGRSFAKNIPQIRSNVPFRDTIGSGRVPHHELNTYAVCIQAQYMISAIETVSGTVLSPGSFNSHTALLSAAQLLITNLFYMLYCIHVIICRACKRGSVMATCTPKSNLI